MAQTIQERFEEFHAANPDVLLSLVGLANQAYNRGRRRIGMKQLFEVLRWNRSLTTTGDEFKLNNNFTSRYVRLIEDQYPHLRGMFEKREVRA